MSHKFDFFFEISTLYVQFYQCQCASTDYVFFLTPSEYSMQVILV